MNTQHRSAPLGGKHPIRRFNVIVLALMSCLLIVGIGTQPVSATTKRHLAVAKKHQTTSKQKQTLFWQNHGYTGTFKRQSTLSKKQMLHNKLMLVFTKDNQFRQRVTTSLSMAGIQEQVTDGTVTKKGNILTLVPKSTATAVYKTASDYDKHAASNYHSSGAAFNNQLIFAADGQPLMYRINVKHHRITGLKTKATVIMKQGKTATLATAQDYIKPFAKQ
ncbi:MAG TPA: hypothetical protein DCW31_08795 [Lactobacillus sp.]|nr:hypothetical protein [Lactobacillus sp.]